MFYLYCLTKIENVLGALLDSFSFILVIISASPKISGLTSSGRLSSEASWWDEVNTDLDSSLLIWHNRAAQKMS